MLKRALKFDNNYYNQLDSHIKVERAWMSHLLDVLEGRKNGESKQILISQVKRMIKENADKIKTKNGNGTINKPLIDEAK